MSDPVAVPERREPSVLLIVSLCVNIAFIGLAAMMVLRGFGPPPREPKGTLSPMAIMRMVPAESAKIQAVMDAHHARIHELRQASMQSRAELFDILSAPALDKAALDKALLGLENADTAMQAETAKTTAESIALLTPDERKTVASQLHKPGRSWLKRMFRHP